MRTSYMRLNEYALSCGFFLMFHDNVTGQIIYQDINPDMLLNFDGDILHLDINDDSNYDLIFERFARSYFSNSYFDGRIRDEIGLGGIASLYTYASILVGELYLPGFGFTASFYSPIVLNEGNIVDHDDNFNINGHLVIRSYSEEGKLIRTDGNWYPEEINKYIGFAFKQDSCIHYGWLRCSILDSGDKLIIKDCAYETGCDKPIIAGSIDSYVDLEYPKGVETPTIHYNSGILYINGNSDFKTLNIHIYDMVGHSVYNEKTASNALNVSSIIQAGMYLVEVVYEKYKCVQKICIE